MKRRTFDIRRVPVSRLSDADVERLWQVYRGFVDAERDAFVRTLMTADDAFLFQRSDTGSLMGFEALRCLPVTVGRKPHLVVCAYYADLNTAARGHNLLQRVALREFVRLRLRHPVRRMVWLFTASTYRSYLLLPHNVIEYWPRRDAPTPAHVRALMDAVMTALHPTEWDADAGVLRRHGALRYHDGLVAVGLRPRDDADIAFYATVNPGQQDGDSLVCACSMSLVNALAVLVRMIRRSRQHRADAVADRVTR